MFGEIFILNNRGCPVSSVQQPYMMPGGRLRPASHWGRRCVAIILLFATTTPLVVTSGLRADPFGLGTHRQLGLPACGVYRSFGFPCFTCGYTTSLTYAAHGDLASAFRVQPAAAVLAIIMAAGAIVAGYALVFGIDLVPLARWLWRPMLVWVVAGGCLGGWIYKILMVNGGY